MKQFIVAVGETELFFKQHQERLSFSVTPYAWEALRLHGDEFAQRHCEVLNSIYRNSGFKLVEFNGMTGGATL